MLLLHTFCIFQVLLLCVYIADALCPHAHELYNVLSIDKNDRIIYDTTSPISYDTYETDCHRFVVQPPPISDANIGRALRQAVNRTNRYISLDIEAAAGVRRRGPKVHTDMDRNNYYFESATKYLQETTCSSKSTTTTFLKTIQLERFQNFLTENVTRVSCDFNHGHIKYPSCSGKSSYRKIDGTCNNLKRPLDGRANHCMLRLLTPDYKDGISELRTSLDGSPLPNARVLSTKLLGRETARPLSNRFTALHSFLGEFVIGDNGMTLRPTTGILIRLQCCDHDNRTRIDHPQCAPIPIAPNDSLRQRYTNQKCMEFERSIPCARCNLGPRMLSSSSTAAQDLQSVYGLTSAMLNARRTKVGGLLKTQTIDGHELFAVERFNASGRFRCFEGNCEISPQDARNVHLPTGQAFVLLFYRNHNRHARQLAKVKPNWSDEKLFQEARRWNIAEYQHCIYSEYFETLIGTNLANLYGILPKPPGQFSKYKADAQLKTVIEFQTTAGRHGHAAINEDIFIIDRKNRRELKLNFRQSDAAEIIFYGGHADGMFLAQMVRQAYETTPSVPFKTFLYNLPGRTFGLDLAALDIQRQRDHGISSYIHYVKYCHGVDIQCWDDLVQFIDPVDIAKLRKHYKYVEDVELYVGGHYERKTSDILVGPTFATIIAIQFHNTKYGDRFFYEHGDQVGSFEMEQLNEIKTKSSFASILCKNTNLEQVLNDPLRLQSYSNPFVSCSAFGDLDYKL